MVVVGAVALLAIVAFFLYRPYEGFQSKSGETSKYSNMDLDAIKRIFFGDPNNAYIPEMPAITGSDSIRTKILMALKNLEEKLDYFFKSKYIKTNLLKK